MLCPVSHVLNVMPCYVTYLELCHVLYIESCPVFDVLCTVSLCVLHIVSYLDPMPCPVGSFVPCVSCDVMCHEYHIILNNSEIMQMAKLYPLDMYSV